MIWLLPKLWRGIRAVVAKIAHWFGGNDSHRPDPPRIEHTPRA